MAVHVGIGSWGDEAYVGVLYPKGLPKSARLRDYARSFNHIEVNASFYATPAPNVTRSWVKQTPPGFTFSLKLHRAFSQSPTKAAQNAVLMKKVRAAAEPLVKGGRLSAFLLVLPPSFAPERHALEECDELVRRLAPHSLAIELRHRDWVTGRQRAATLDYFRERKLIWVAVDMPRIADSALMPPVDVVTNPAQAYLRMHGRNPNYFDAKSAAEGHAYAYAPREIAQLAKRVRALAKGADEVFAIANNHANDFAPKTALALQALLRRAPRAKRS